MHSCNGLLFSERVYVHTRDFAVERVSVPSVLKKNVEVGSRLSRYVCSLYYNRVRFQAKKNWVSNEYKFFL